MHIEELRDYCLSKKGVEEFKVMGKIFLLVGLENNPIQFNVKCSPDKAIELREMYSCVIPGYHMNKQHWNTIICDGSVNSKLVFTWIDDSYHLVSDSLTKQLKQQLNEL